MKSIRLKLVFMYLSLVFIVLILTGTIIIVATETREKNQAKEELRQCAVYIDEQVIEQYDSRYYRESLVNLASISSSLKNVSGNILDGKGNTIASSSVKEKEELPKYTSAAIISALNGTDKFTDNDTVPGRDGEAVRMLSYAYPISDDKGNVEYVVFVTMNAEQLYSSLAKTVQTLVASMVVALLFTAVLGVLFASTITAPIALLTKKAKLMAKGRLEQKVPVKGNDEIGQLTKSFNIMARELAKSVTEMEEQRNKLEIVLMNMTDGVMAFDERGKLIHINRAAYDLIDIDEVNISLKWLLEKLGIDLTGIATNTIFEKVLENIDNGKYVSAAFIPYALKNKMSGIIVVLHDITKHRQLDNMRQEFVANVSHEIGTPLTTIKGYAELLLDGAIEDESVAKDFLKEINEAADRMRLLRDDLLDLSRFDMNVNKLNKEEVDLVEITKGCVRQNKIVAEKKKQKIVFEPPEKEMIIYADVGRVNQVITNIMSNAMKYSDEGTQITLKLEEKITTYDLSVIDRGIGMPEEAVERIFDRFYRVDKARSRAMGGNGLGLAIAKEIMTGHNGAIDVYSELDKGTTMVLRFPKNDMITFDEDFIKDLKESKDK
ncbi:MAG: HAMP domain-containing protein [Firmicutes bacterium]|nr:HAMP domain-containing protein [Bacillota bacterium]